MKYFAKYLPVEGEVNIGDNFIDTGVMNLIGKRANKHGDYSGYQKVKLFLCSRDIQVGDTVKALLVDKFGYKDYLITDKDSAELSIEMGDFKVIGEISPEATWVKEGDEFDRTEARQYINLSGMWLYRAWNKDLKGHVPIIKIKCPCCNTFK